MKRKKRKISSDSDIAAYWDTHDATEVLDLHTSNRVEMIYEPPVRSISLRLPVPLLARIKQIAAKMDIAYQSLIKVWLTERARQPQK